MAPLATPTNLHPSSSANGLNVWHQEVITKRTRADTLMTFKLTSECYGSTGISTPTCILGNSFTTWFSHMKNPGSHRDPLISIWRGPWAVSLPKRPSYSIAQRPVEHFKRRRKFSSESYDSFLFN